MLICTSKCDWKCCRESGNDISLCHNSPLSQQPDIEVSVKDIYERYVSNSITKSLVIAGLEPILQFDEVYELIEYFRKKGCADIIVLYTGYEAEEIFDELSSLTPFGNIIVKTGRYKPNLPTRYDEVLGVTLASSNQKGMRL